MINCLLDKCGHRFRQRRRDLIPKISVRNDWLLCSTEAAGGDGKALAQRGYRRTRGRTQRQRHLCRNHRKGLTALATECRTLVSNNRNRQTANLAGNRQRTGRKQDSGVSRETRKQRKQEWMNGTILPSLLSLMKY